ncbi:MAG: VOC family protein [Actinomycetota bacterium]|nr:VOC family protein [Actinomycetota bacterium]
MDISVGMVVIDCADPLRLAEFWASATGYTMQESDERWAWLLDPNGSRIEIGFQRVPEPKLGKNRVHLDLHTPDEEAEAERIEALGGTRLRRSDNPDDIFIVFADPEGNEFCIVREVQEST